MSLLVDLLCKGYKMKAEDWRRGSLEVVVVMEEVTMKSYLFFNKEAVRPSSLGESVMEKLDKLHKLVEDEFKSTNKRLSNPSSRNLGRISRISGRPSLEKSIHTPSQGIEPKALVFVLEQEELFEISVDLLKIGTLMSL
ncbi:unnamed protein product [Arabidopsis lyrata]|uniref:Predicted protein n=1 Tax=Arabidopsis lyrata subsp. lyrata TaxID=81972 RepID=D7KUP5_ARALL|nr:predicted protein [Arabidopsis lyrata subsp. lyrata]CAH8256109.1 unnamed protein product [Arabidopsis lyrata]